MKKQNPDKRLLREAFDLVVAVYDDSKRRPELDVWRKQSPAHEQAVIQAEADWKVLGQVDDVPLSFFDTFKLAIRIRLARVSENPLRLAPTLGVAMVLIAVVYLDLVPAFRSQPEAVLACAEASSAVSPKSYRTCRGQQRTISLDDGSEVWLDWSTELIVSMTASERQITLLRGKALFSVASDPDRPFSVASESAVTTALGTEFVVHRLDDQVIEVAVLEGSVGVQGGGGASRCD